MHVEHHAWWSPALGQNMELKVYGHWGRPVLVFPSQDGRYYDFEGFGMAEACCSLVDAGRVKFFAVDGIDFQSWTNKSLHPADRARRHQQYERHIVDEVVPFIERHTGLSSCWTTGCSMGAFHAANAFFRRPDLFDGVIGLSGLYRATAFTDGYSDDAIYFNSPLDYLPGLQDLWHLDRYRSARIAFAVGQGAWEEDCLRDTRQLDEVIAAKGIPAWFDYWGTDVNHDWPWWRRMLPHLLARLEV
ncbi:MAG: alpha/beta hydrolase-fold protein [Acidobacteriota bacterium]